jgi:hypothetical protein
MNIFKKLAFSGLAAFALLASSHAYAGYVAPEAGYSGAQVAANFRSIAGAVGVAGDDTSSSFTLPFAFTFYGHTYAEGSEGWISANGLLGFDMGNRDDDDAYCCHATYHQFSPTNTVVAGWFDLLGTIYTHTGGVAGQRELVFTWVSNEYDADAVDGIGAANRFQAILHETSNNIEFQYAELNALVHFASAGGIRGDDSTEGMNYVDFGSDVRLADVGLLITYQAPTADIPEPGSLVLLGLGLAGIALARRTSKRATWRTGLLTAGGRAGPGRTPRGAGG